MMHHRQPVQGDKPDDDTTDELERLEVDS
jgi:hypothetical protein